MFAVLVSVGEGIMKVFLVLVKIFNKADTCR